MSDKGFVSRIYFKIEYFDPILKVQLLIQKENY